MPGQITDIVADDTDTTAFAVPFDELFDITMIIINNRCTDNVRIRGWDTFTDTDGTAHTSAASPVEVFDVKVVASDGLVIPIEEGSKRVMGTLVLQAHSDSGAGIGASTDVVVDIGGNYWRPKKNRRVT